MKIDSVRAERRFGASMTLAPLVVALIAVATQSTFATQMIDFDDVDVLSQPRRVNIGNGTPTAYVSGDHYLNQGVLFTTGKSSADTFDVGSDIEFAKWRDQILLAVGPYIAISEPNFMFPGPPSNSTGGATEVLALSRSPFGLQFGRLYFDLLLTFTTPVTSIEIASDKFPMESPDPLRLVALEAGAVANEFRVLGVDEKFDDAVAAPDNLLSVNLGGQPFSYALIQVNSELEGFDNLRFTQVPEPNTAFLAGLLALAFVLAKAPLGRVQVELRRLAWRHFPKPHAAASIVQVNPQLV